MAGTRVIKFMQKHQELIKKQLYMELLMEAWHDDKMGWYWTHQLILMLEAVDKDTIDSICDSFIHYILLRQCEQFVEDMEPNTEVQLGLFYTKYLRHSAGYTRDEIEQMLIDNQEEFGVRVEQDLIGDWVIGPR